MNTTWEWDGSRWAAPPSLVSPPARIEHALAHQAGRGRTLLFGGISTAQGLLGDTWEWDGIGWTAHTPVVAPSPRAGAALADDSARGRAVLFGGAGALTMNDTWEWDGSAWTRLQPSARPPGRTQAAMAFDPARRRTVLFGGSGPAYLADTWEWDATSWSRRTPPASPSPRFGCAMVFDAVRGRVLLFGGQDATGPLSDLWEWDGASWTRLQPRTSPPAQLRQGLAWDVARQRVVLVGAGTWELVHGCAPAGPGHPGGGLPLVCSGVPTPAGPVTLSFAGAGWLLLGSRFTLSPPRALGPPLLCASGTLHVQPAAALPTYGVPIAIAIPPIPALVGAEVIAQGFALQPAGCWRATDALALTVIP